MFICQVNITREAMYRQQWTGQARQRYYDINEMTVMHSELAGINYRYTTCVLSPYSVSLNISA